GSAQSGKRCRLIGVRSVVVETEVDVVVRPVSAASSAATSTTATATFTTSEQTKHACLPEVMDDAEVHAVTVVFERGYVVEVLGCAGKIRKWNEAQQRLRGRADLGCGNHIAGERLPGLRIEDLHRQT